MAISAPRPQLNTHVLGPPCQASAPGLINGPAGMAPISWICYNHIRSSLLRPGRSGHPSALHSRPLNPCRLGQLISLWLNFSLTLDKVIIGHGRILHTVEMSLAGIEGVWPSFLKATKSCFRKKIRHLASCTVAGQSPSPASCVQACLVHLSVKLGCLGP